ncbi:MAG: hypothetical protein DMG70_17280 [Acidobacteria bacterium]|nr:MAG: hypothetical protein DMG70_17280 [Acidobacteriota bacterium]PYY11102.1 MAG: hypothetical protein DMG69_04820 [Acidobacteriota bacterium]
MRRVDRKSERGVSLLFSMLALLLLTAIAAGMMFMSSTETSISSNFKAEETAYFASRAGVEEVRDRMLKTNPNTINCTTQVTDCGLMPTALPSAAGGVLYILQNGVTGADITNIVSSNQVADDELCHDFPYNGAGYGGMTPVGANVRCTTLPAGPLWYTTTASTAPFAGSNNPLDYKWVRVTLKAANSTAYPVDPTQPAATNQVCWNGTSEVLLPGGTATCNLMVPETFPVYMVTSLATTASGGRRLIQQEIAQTPPPAPPGGLFATGTGCGALNVAGNARTGSFNSSTQTPGVSPPSNLTNNNGDIGANGNLSVGGSSAHVNGNLSTNMQATIGGCPGNGVSTSGNPGLGPLVHFNTPYLPPVPPLPNPLPPQTSVTYNGGTITPGSYGNVTFKGNVTLQGGTAAHPAVYTMNSITFNGNATVTVNGPVLINLAGINQSTVLTMTGNSSFANSTFVPSNLVINYGGTDSMAIAGGSSMYAIVSAPNAPITINGGSDIYGQIIGNTIDDQGGVNFYWDLAANAPVQNTSSFFEISMRELSY